MDLEHDLKKLRWALPPENLRRRILRGAAARAESPSRPLVFSWAAVERHWLYPGRFPVTALALIWLAIASLHFTTPVSLLPRSGSSRISKLSEDDLARIEILRAHLVAELSRDDPQSTAPPDKPSRDVLPPRS